jgi:hypothetical protein
MLSEDERIVLAGTFAEGGSVASRVFPGLEAAVADIFAD